MVPWLSYVTIDLNIDVKIYSEFWL
jgi:hypothetical protein